MSQDLHTEIDQRPMTVFQWSVVGVCMALNMIDGFDVLVMAFTASAVASALAPGAWRIARPADGLLL